MSTGTIQTDLREQFLRCRVCREVHEIPRRILRDPEAVMTLVEDVTEDHRECAANAANPRLAMNQRQFRKRMERELKRDREPLRRRCSGR